MNTFFKGKIIWRFLVFFIVAGCSSDSIDNEEEIAPPITGEVTFDRGAMLINWADNIILPSYESFATDMESLKSSFDQFQTDRTLENLTMLRSEWLDAYKMWQRVSMFEIGPAETIGFRLNMNIYPTNNTKIEEWIASGVYDLSLSSSRDGKGFPALDFLFNGIADTDSAILNRYTGADGDKIIALANDILTDMSTMTETVLQEWKSGYRDVFVSNDGASSTASVDRLVNDYIFYYEKFLRAGKMGIPLGVFSGNTLARNVEAYFSADVSNSLFLEGLDAFQNFFNGRHFNGSNEGESLSSYLNKLNSVKQGEDLSAIINAQFNNAMELVTPLQPFRTEIENNSPPTNMLLAYDEVQKVVPLLKVDMVSAMSISIDFVDADGD